MSLPTSKPSSPGVVHDEPSTPKIGPQNVAWDVPEVAAALVDLRGLRAVCIGAAVIVGGSLVMTTMLGIIAITAGLVRGETAEMIVAGLPQSLALALFVAIGALLASAVGGYTATSIAGLAQRRHAAWAGILAIPLCIATSALLGDVGPGWLSAMSLAAIVPMAVLGGHLASPREHVSFQRI